MSVDTLQPNDALITEVSVPGVASQSAGDDSSASREATIRVMHVINGEHYSGAERVQDLLGQHLPTLGYRAAFACIKPGRFADKRQDQDSRLFELPMASRFDVRVARQLAKIIRDDDYALVHAHTPRSAIVGRLASWWAGVPMVYHVHSPTSADSTNALRNRLNDMMERASLFRASALITVSRSLGQHMGDRGYDSQIVSVVPNGVPASVRRRGAVPPSETWHIGTVALFRPRKGLEVLLDAIALLKRRGLTLRLRAVGPFETEEYEAEIMQRVERLGLGNDIVWVGFTQDVTRELTQMDLFVLPSLFGEGLPMVVLEAMAAGVPVVGTQVEGVPEAIKDGVNGVIAKPGDSEDLAHAMRRIIDRELDWCDLRARAIRSHAESFSAERMAEGVAAVYDRVLDATRVN